MGTARRARITASRITTDAFVLRVVAFGDADAVVTVFTRALGKVAVLARGARRGGKRWSGVLEPMHTLRLLVEDRATAELLTLREASISRPRLALIADLDCMTAAGQALRWIRAAAAPRAPEPGVWMELERLLDRLNDLGDDVPPATQLASTGLRLLRLFGYELELSSCVRCGRRCHSDRSAYVDTGLGGLLCQSCGGGHGSHQKLLLPDVRARLIDACEGTGTVLLPCDTDLTRTLVDDALASHAGLSDGC